METQLHDLVINFEDGDESHYEAIQGFYHNEIFSVVHYPDGKIVGIKTHLIDSYTITPIKKVDPGAS